MVRAVRNLTNVNFGCPHIGQNTVVSALSLDFIVPRSIRRYLRRKKLYQVYTNQSSINNKLNK